MESSVNQILLFHIKVILNCSLAVYRPRKKKSNYNLVWRKHEIFIEIHKTVIWGWWVGLKGNDLIPLSVAVLGMDVTP